MPILSFLDRLLNRSPAPKRSEEWQSPERENVSPNIQQKEPPMAYLPLSTRNITEIWIHCTATMPHIKWRAKDIDRVHRDRGFSNGIGYNGVICRDGEFEKGRDVNIAGAHTYRHNTNSIGVVMVGGLGDDNRPAPEFTRAQWHTLKKVVASLQEQYPNAKVRGHNELGGKACPSFVVSEWMRNGTVKPVR